MLPDIERVAARIREVAAIEILPRFQKLAAAEMHEKQPGQLVTIADIEAERRLTPLLEEMMADSVVVGEEGVAGDPSRLASIGGPDPVWLVDPVDGTQNFAEGNPTFVTMVALIAGGRTAASWIYEPIADRMTMAEVGSGAYSEGVRLRSATAVPLPQMNGRMGSRTARKLRGKVGSALFQRCAGKEYLAVAGGAAHFALFRRLFPWDHAPGELLVREAGAFAQRLDRTAYVPAEIDATLLVAPDEPSWEELRTLILEHAP
jgi:fructose-1,6-bisphosphatase/inositol monophosphatase family enzyme